MQRRRLIARREDTRTWKPLGKLRHWLLVALSQPDEPVWFRIGWGTGRLDEIVIADEIDLEAVPIVRRNTAGG